jgi:REP-associated tyrosine transposase
MPRRPRIAISATYFHVMNRSSRRMKLFATVRDYLSLLHVISDGLDRHHLDLLSFCIMPNHWHLVVHVDDLAELSKFMHWITTTHARRWHRYRRTFGDGPVYKGRFLSVPIVSEVQLVRVCRYVERNAVRAGLARRAQDWSWSSLAERKRTRKRVSLLSMPFLESDEWQDYVNAAEESAQAQVSIDKLNRAVRLQEQTPIDGNMV